MSVYTTIEESELKNFLANYAVGELVDYQGISDGIENTNYFVNTSHGRFVLTIFEQHSFEEMQYYLNLMHHLADHKVPSANPVADKQGHYLSHFKDKPIALVERLNGSSIIETTINHCAQLGTAMGKMHDAGLSFKEKQINLRGPDWCQQTAQQVMERLSADEQHLLDEEIHFQKNDFNNFGRDASLPCGVTHADLFRDNALWNDNNFSGIIDFYYSCDDVLLYDLAVAVNDWCTDSSFNLNKEKVLSFLTSYNSCRPLTDSEQTYWPAMLRAGALRFWLSRLYDKHFPRGGELVHTKNPDEFKNILADRIKHSDVYFDFWL
ncbi:Homoserine kinase [hydrothermal vent metagenome]|uniref:Homoserine kinase n=1 Tax=hydrothermal vent metagenome TaxID=652676 RepID=A0A3B0WFD3_9ZZZZ